MVQIVMRKRMMIPSDGSRDDDENEDGHVEGDQEYGHVDAVANAHESQRET